MREHCTPHRPLEKAPMRVDIFNPLTFSNFMHQRD